MIESYPLTKQQTDFLEPEEEVSGIYNIAIGFSGQGKLCIDSLVSAFRAAHQDFFGLSSRLTKSESGIMLSGFDKTSFDIRLIDLSYSDANFGQVALHQLKEIKSEAMNPWQGEVSRMAIITGKDNQFSCLVILHHMIVDGIHLAILTQRLADLYQHIKNGLKPQTWLDDSYNRYHNYLKSLPQRDSYEESLKYYKKKFADSMISKALTDKSGSEAIAYPGHFSRNVRKLLFQATKHHRSSPFSVFSALFGYFISEKFNFKNFSVSFAENIKPASLGPALGHFASLNWIPFDIGPESTTTQVIETVSSMRRKELQILKVYELEEFNVEPLNQIPFILLEAPLNPNGILDPGLKGKAFTMTDEIEHDLCLTVDFSSPSMPCYWRINKGYLKLQSVHEFHLEFERFLEINL